MLTGIDYAVIACYGVLMAALGYVAKRLVKNPEDYFAGGKRVPWWLAAVSHHMSGYSTYAFVGLGTLAYGAGLPAWTYFAPPVCLSMIIGAFVWAPRWSRMKILTPVQFLEERYNNTVRQVFGWSGIAVKFIDEGAKLYSLALIVHVLTGWQLVPVIIGCGIITILYLFFGGLWATMLTDFAQFIVQFALTLLLVPLVLNAVGGLSGLWNQMPPAHRQLFGGKATPGFVFVSFLVILLSYNGGTWGLAQRFYSIGKPRQARKAALLSAFLYLLYPLAIFIPMWAARSIVGELADPEHAYVLVAQKLLSSVSPGLLGLLVSSMFAATMSMVDSDINSLSAVFTKDIYQRTFDRTASDRRLLRVGMGATVVLGALTVAAALVTIRIESAFKAIVEWFFPILGPIALPLLLGMLHRRTTWRGALASWVAGFGTFFFVKYGWPALTGQATSFAWYTGLELLVCLVVFLVEGQLARPSPEERQRVERFFRQFEDMG